MENSNTFWFTAKKLALGLILIGMAASVLLLSDRRSRKTTFHPPGTSAPIKVHKVAVIQNASQPILEQGVQGMLDGLAARGFMDGEALEISRFNAEGDMPTLNAIAKEASSGKFDMILTVSTPALQAVANANKAGKAIHVFALVTDPYAAGVGINPTNHLDHPRHIIGFGTFQPVFECFRLLRQCNPEIKSVGVVWNPAESNSEANTKQARIICKELGIKLEEATVDNSSGVSEAANSLISRGVEALWVGGDSTVLVAVEQVLSSSRKAGIPVFTVIPPNAERGALFDLGANYYEVGKMSGELAGDVLGGRAPETVSIDNVVPEILVVNKAALNGLKGRWSVPEVMETKANTLIADNGQFVRKVESVRTMRFQSSKVYKIGIAYFGPDPGAEACMDGLFAGLKKLGLEEGKNLKVRKMHAQGEISNIPAMMQAMDGEDVDVVIPMSTPCITSACAQIKKKKVVFTYCYDPIAAGVGKSFTDHLPHMTGIGSFPPVEETIQFIRKTIPGVQAVGTLYNSSEANSRKVIEVARPLFAKAGIKLEEVAIASSSEVFQAAQVLATRGIQALWITGDNTALQAFDGISKAADSAKLPLVINDPEYVERGALACIGLGFYHSGLATAEPLARVLLGETPKSIPIKNVSMKTVVLNENLAKKLNITFSDDVRKEAEEAKKASEKSSTKPVTKKWNIHLIELVEATAIEESRQGVMLGLKEAGLIEGKDYTLKRRNAQGELSLLTTLIDAAITEKADMIYTITTPALQAALPKVKDRPLLFCLALSPVTLGGSKSDLDHQPNVTGVYDRSPFEQMVKLVKQLMPNAKRIGTLYAPAEANSVYFRDEFTKVCRAAGLELVAVPANTSSEVSDAANALCGKEIDILCQLSDNLSGASFVSIGIAARRAKVPLFSFATGQIKQGALLALSNDYIDEGRESAHMAARVMRGEDPINIPLSPTKKTTLVVNLENQQYSPLKIPENILDAADDVMGRPKPKTTAAPAPKRLTKKWKIHIIEYSNILDVDETRQGIFDGFKQSGLVEGKDYEFKILNAQNDMPTINILIDSAISEGTDLLMTLSTPTLQAAIKKAKKVPVVFTYVADGIAAGAGKSNEDHLPTVTGVPTIASYDEMILLIKECLPHVRKLGSLYVPSESNTVVHRDLFLAAAKRHGMEVIFVPADTASEVGNASSALSQQGIDMVCQIPGNLTASAFPAMASALRKTGLPIFAFQIFQATHGASVVLARDYHDAGIEASQMAVRIMYGEDPAKIPFKPVTRSRLIINSKAAAACNLVIPAAVIKRAEKTLE